MSLDQQIDSASVNVDQSSNIALHMTIVQWARGNCHAAGSTRAVDSVKSFGGTAPAQLQQIFNVSYDAS